MPLESLLALVEKLRKRIDNYGDALNEAQTRKELIEPLLRELGWDTEDRTSVISEYKIDGGGSSDYALLRNGQPVMMMEAKRLGKQLQEARTQGLRYCLAKPVTPYFSVTDGRHWEIYATYKSRLIDEKEIVKQVAEFDLEDRSATEVCLKALTLWELRVSGHITTGQIPDGGPSHKQPDSSESPTPQPTPPSPDEHEWQPLSKLKPQSHDPSPVEIQFPDNSVVQVKAWKWLLVAVARWLMNNNHLKTRHCPIRCRPKGKTHLAVSTKSVHLSRKQFSEPIPIGSFYVETHGGCKYVSTACRTVIDHVGQDPAEFKVRFSPPGT